MTDDLTRTSHGEQGSPRPLPSGVPSRIGRYRILRVIGEGGMGTVAEPLLREALSIREEKLPPGDWARSVTESMLGEALAEQRKFEAAEPLLLRGYEGMKDSAAVPALRKREGLERIVRLYEAWGKPDQAAKWRALDRSR